MDNSIPIQLEPLIYYIKNSKNLNLDRLKLGIEYFCKNYSYNLKNDFFNKIDISYNCQSTKEFSYEPDYKAFLEHLTGLDGECVFLLRDTYDLMKQYQRKTGEGIGIVINRGYLFDNEQEYFELLQLFYETLILSTNYESFLKQYEISFNTFIEKGKLQNKAIEIAEYIEASLHQDKIYWIDIGLNFTFNLFGFFSLKKYSRRNIEQEILLFSAYPWLENIFKNNFYSNKLELVNAIEIDSAHKYEQEIVDKSKGAIMGFAIGDSLGFPVAGINYTDLKSFIKIPISGFENNKMHPFFNHLNKAQYTDNTILMLLTCNNIISNEGFKIDDYLRELKKWGENIIVNKYEERWAGPTALAAVKKLIEGYSEELSGSTNTMSCSSTYRVIPLGIFYRTSINSIVKLSEKIGSITHNSEISKTGCIITSLIISNLLNGFTPMHSVITSIKLIEEKESNSALTNSIQDVINWYNELDVDNARIRYGTGSSISKTLPLAIYYFLKFSDNFEKGIIAAANSYRNDSPVEKKKLQHLGFIEQMQECDGGNTDGIAGLTGAFLGAHLGLSKIPNNFKEIENNKLLIESATKLVRSDLKPIIIFDIDNTILTSYKLYDNLYKLTSRDIWNVEFAMTLNPDGSKDNAFSQLTNNEILAKRISQLGLDKSKSGNFFKIFDKNYSKIKNTEHSIIFPNVDKLFDKLSNCNLVLLSTGTRKIQIDLLFRFGILHYFNLEHSMFVGDFIDKKEAIESIWKRQKGSLIVHISDSPNDMSAVKQANIETARIAVGTTISGVIDKESLLNSGADYVVHDYSDKTINNLLKFLRLN